MNNNSNLTTEASNWTLERITDHPMPTPQNMIWYAYRVWPVSPSGEVFQVFYEPVTKMFMTRHRILDAKNNIDLANLMEDIEVDIGMMHTPEMMVPAVKR